MTTPDERAVLASADRLDEEARHGRWECAGCGRSDVTPSITEPEVCVDCSH